MEDNNNANRYYVVIYGEFNDYSEGELAHDDELCLWQNYILVSGSSVEEVVRKANSYIRLGDGEDCTASRDTRRTLQRIAGIRDVLGPILDELVDFTELFLEERKITRDEVRSWPREIGSFSANS